EIGFEKTLVIAAGDEANFLRVGLLGDQEAMLAGDLTHLGLGHVAKGKQGPAQLVLRKAKEEVSLVLRPVGGPLQQPATELIVKDNLGIVSGSNLIGANLLRHNKKLIKLQVIVAEAARDGRASCQILFNEGPDDVAFKTLFVVNHVIRNAKGLGDPAG